MEVVEYIYHSDHIPSNVKNTKLITKSCHNPYNKPKHLKTYVGVVLLSVKHHTTPPSQLMQLKATYVVLLSVKHHTTYVAYFLYATLF